MRFSFGASAALFAAFATFGCGGDDDPNQPNDPDETNDRWYGDIAITVTTDQTMNTTFPGLRNRSQVSWDIIALVSVTAEGKRTLEVNAYYDSFQEQYVTSDCFSERASNVSGGRNTETTTKTNAYFNLATTDSGTYRSTDGMELLSTDVPISISGRDVIITCDTSMTHTNESTTPMPISAVVDYSRIMGMLQEKGRRANGFVDYDLPGGTHVRLDWDLRKDEDIVAVAGGPYNVARGERVTLDGSRSRGMIDTYEWTVTPTARCEGMGQQVTIMGAMTTFTALCPLTAKLRVRGPAGSDTDTKTVRVNPRPWKTTFARRASTRPLSVFLAGTNVCQIEGEATGHFLHRDAPSSWRDVGYVLKQVEESDKPFDGVWYIDTSRLRVTRDEITNTAYLPGGAVYDHNIALGGIEAATVMTLTRQIPAHERAHSDLLREWLERHRGERDPARRIEKLMSDDEEDLVEQADGSLIEDETELTEATSHPFVWERLSRVAEFTGNGQFEIPGAKENELRIVDAFYSLGGDDL